MIGCDNENYFLLLEKCNNRSLRQVMKSRLKVTEDEVRYWMAQLLDALNYLHSNQICHRDLKLDNIFLHERQVKLGDFGFSVRLGPNVMTKTFCGTPNYIAPEVVARTEYSFPVDVWAIGVLVYTMVYGTPPFETAAATTTYQKITNGDYAFPEQDTSSEEVKDVIRKCLQHDPKDRPTCAALLAHPFFNPALIPASLPSNALGFSVSSASTMTAAANNTASKKRGRNAADAAHLDAIGGVPVAKRFVGLGENKENTGHNGARTPVASNAALRTVGSGATPQSAHSQNAASGTHVTSVAEPAASGLATSAVAHGSGGANGQASGQQARNGGVGATATAAPAASSKAPSKVVSVPWDHEYHENTLKRIVTRLNEIASQPAITSVPKVPPPCVTPHDAHRLGHHWIVKWLDYSQRFGLSFQLCNNTIGVLFVDYSSLLTKVDSTILQYSKMVNPAGTASSPRPGEGVSRFASASISKTIYEELDLAVHKPLIESRTHLKNRVELLDNFTEYMKVKLAASSGLAMMCDGLDKGGDESAMDVDESSVVATEASSAPKASKGKRAEAQTPKAPQTPPKSHAAGKVTPPAFQSKSSKIDKMKHSPLGPRKDLIGLLAWAKTDFAIIFLFTNYTVQINFYDHVKLVLTLPDLATSPSATELITVVSEKGVGVTRTVQQILDGGVLTSSLISKFQFAANTITSQFITS
jgi:hypothetical protein